MDLKNEWLSRYEFALAVLFGGYSKLPGWVIWPAGHMYLGQGKLPEDAARLYFNDTQRA